MSGGSWDYVCWKFQETAYRLLNESCPYRRALGKQILSISGVLHDIEWADSSDISKEDALVSLKKHLTHEEVLDVLCKDAQSNIRKLKEVLNKIEEK